MLRRVKEEELHAFEALLDKYKIKDVSDIMEHLESLVDAITSDNQYDYVRTPYAMLAVDIFDPTLVHVWANPFELLELVKKQG
jgi:hypothetical protein